MQAACGSFGMLIFAERQRSLCLRVIYTEKAFCIINSAALSGCVMAGGATRWRREREVELSTCTECRAERFFYYWSPQKHTVHDVIDFLLFANQDRKSWAETYKERHRVEAGCHRREIAPAAKEILRRTWHSGKWKHSQGAGGNLTLSRVQDAKRAKPIHISICEAHRVRG